MNLDEILLDDEALSKLVERICLNKVLVRRILETDHLGSRLLKRMEAAEESLQQLAKKDEIMKISVSECIMTGQHLKSCDNDGFCNLCGHQDDPLWSGIPQPADLVEDDHPQTADEWLKKNGGWVDEVAEANDNLGMCQGVAFTMLCLLAPPGLIRQCPPEEPEWVHVVQLVFEHGIVDARRDTFELLSIRTLTRFDGS